MSTDESLEDQTKLQAGSLAAEAIDWGFQFLKVLELEYSNAAAGLPAQATLAEFRRAMIRAFESTLVESGADPRDVPSLIHESLSLDQSVEKSAGWTSELNARRIELIDKMIQQSLSATEAAELSRLTARLRLHVDNEELVPLEGARQIHKRLLESGNAGARQE
ncbi:MAG TPA: hypothetical protein VFI31_26765 [Pirellulales bacterium]|nr:hypothetical protein [Pirellulales bacterium]